MYENEVKLLRNRVEKLTAEGFDLEAWKDGTIVLLNRIFGEDNQKSRQIEKIRFELNSWSLRDAKGSKNLIESCKKRGEEILQVAIEELENFGLPTDVLEQQQEPFKKVIINALEESLKVAQMREIKLLLATNEKEDELKKKVLNKLESYGATVIPDMLANILVSKESRTAIGS